MHYGQTFMRSMREQRVSVRNAIIFVMKKLNSFEMLPKECANEIYSCLNVLVEEVNGLGLTQMQPSDVVRKDIECPPH